LRVGWLLLLTSALVRRGLSDEAAASFRWSSTYAEGRDAALRASRPLIIYLPPARSSEEPPIIRKLPQLAGSPPLVVGVRASADEVLGFLERFKLKKLPALVLLDRRENVIAGWEGGLPADLWSKLQAAVRRIDKRDEDDARTLAEARRASAQGQLDAAYRKVAPLLDSQRTAPDTLEGARKIEESLLAALRASELRILAGEGLRPGDELRKELEALRATTAHAAFQSELAREIAKLKSSSVGAR
jgi:hypothetical protein